MAGDGDALVRQLAGVIAAQARNILKGIIKSKTLRDTMKIAFDNVPGLGIGLVTFPPHWAGFYHDGRGAMTARPGHYLVFFKDPTKDPRLTPDGMRARKLSKAEFYQYARSGMLTITKHVGKMSGAKFLKGLRKLAKAVTPLVAPRVEAHVREVLGDLWRIKGTVVLY